MRSAWWSKVLRSVGVANKPKRQPYTYTRLRCELLEDRYAPAAIIWEGDVSADWGDAGNWTGGVPTSADDVTIVAPGGAVVFQPTLNVNALTQNLTIDLGATLTGNAAFSLSISGNLDVNGTYSPTGSATLFTAAAGTQTLDGGTTTFANVSHTGAGILQLANSPLTVGGTLTNAAGAGNFDANGLAVTATGLTTVSAGTYLASTGTQTFNGGLTIDGGTFTGDGGIVSASNVTLSSGTLTAPTAAGAFNVSGDWTKTGASTFTHNSGTVTFNGSTNQSLRSGGTAAADEFNNIVHSGTATLQLTNNDVKTVGTFTNSAGITDLNGKDAIVNALTLTGGAINNTGGAGASITSSTAYDVQAGSIGAKLGGAVGLTKTTAGAVTLSGANTYTGPTAVNAGTLLVNGSLVAASAVTVNNSATLGGTGDIDGTLDVNDTAHLAPGTSPGILNSGSVTFDATSTFDVEINGISASAPDFDQLIVTGSATLNGAILNLTGTHTPALTNSFTILKTTTGVTGQFAGLPQGANLFLNGSALKIDYTANGNKDVVLTFDPNPTLSGTGGTDSFTITKVGANVVVKNGLVTLLTSLLAGLTDLKINGLGGNDTLTVDYSGGDPIPVGGITFDGGPAGNDKLVVIGTGVEDAVYTPDVLLTGKGTVSVDADGAGAGVARVINFVGLEPVDLTGLANASLFLPLVGANDTLDIANGVNSNGDAALVVTGTTGNSAVGLSDGVAIELAAFRNNTTVTINTTLLDGNDQVTITSANNLHGNTNLTINTGAGTDNLIVNGAVNVTGTFTATVPTVNLNNNITAGTITGSATTVNVNNTTAQIQDGIAVANAGGTVNIAAGTFAENVVVNKSVTLDGAGATTIIDPTAAGHAINVAANNVTLKDLRVTGTTGAGNDGVHAENINTLTLNNVTADNNVDAGVDARQFTAGITFIGGTYNTNGGHGIALQDIVGLASLTGTEIRDNTDDGLNAVDTAADADTLALGGLTLSGVTIINTAPGVTQNHGVSVGDIGGPVNFTDNALVPNTITDNSLSGVTLGNVGGLVNITSTHSAKYSENTGGDGIRIASLTGVLTVSGVFVTDNVGHGLNVGDGGTTANITSSTFSNNTAGTGVFLNSAAGDFTGTVTLTTVSTSFNSIDGINARGINKLVLDGVTANNNTQEGLDANLTGLTHEIKGTSQFNNNGRGMLMNGGGTVAITNTTFSNNISTGNGAGINNANGILNLTAVTISANQTSGVAAQGAGIFNAAGSTVNLTATANVEIIGNRALGAASEGGGIFNLGTFFQTNNSTFNLGKTGVGNGNSAANGGGIFVAGGDVSFNSANVVNNTATASGGGLFASAGNLTLNSTTFSANSALANSGGGLIITGTTNPAEIRNNTISGNTGDGIVVAAGTINLTHSTIAFNTGDGVQRNGGTVNAINSLFASNTANDFNGTVTSGGFNLFQSSTGVAGTVATDILNQQARLAPLANYGGLTQSHALLPGSFALNAVLVDGAALATDQRGVTRPTPAPQPAFKDIGSYESRGFDVTRIAVTNGAGVNAAPAGDTAFRTLIDNFFLNSDGSTSLQFAVKVAANDPLLTDLTGGFVTFTVPSGAATPTAPANVALTLSGPDFIAQDTVKAGLVPSVALTPYALFATVDPNDTALAAGDPNLTNWNLFNQKVTSLSFAASGFVTNTGTAGDGKIQITTSTDHLLRVGQTIVLTGVNGNPAANGVFTVFQVINATNFSLTGTVGAAASVSTGIFASTNGPSTAITNITSAVGDPIVINRAAHGLIAGQQVTVTGVLGMTSANNTFSIEVIDANNFRLLGSKGNAAYVAATGSYVATFAPAPQNTESGNNQFGGVRFKNVDGIFTKQYYVTMLDQDAIARPVVIDGKSVSLEALIGGVAGGVINGISSVTGFQTANLAAGTVTENSERGIVAFNNTRIFKSTHPSPYQFNARFTNPDAGAVAQRTSPFNVVALNFQAEGGNFAGAQQTVLTVVIVDSQRGSIRLVEKPDTTVSSLGTNQLRIRAFDFSDPTNNVFASSYNGPVVLTFNVNVKIGANPVTPANTPVTFNMTNGELLLNDVVTEAVDAFTVTANFTLTDFAGSATVVFDTTAFSGGQFVRSNVGRQRGR